MFTVNHVLHHEMRDFQTLVKRAAAAMDSINCMSSMAWDIDLGIATNRSKQTMAIGRTDRSSRVLTIDPVRPRNAGKHLRCGVVLAAIN